MAEGHKAEPAAIRAAVQAIWEKARHRINDNLIELENAVATLVREGSLPEPARESAARIAHQLAGSSGTFGFPEATVVARELEEALTAPTPDQAGRIQELITQLRAILLSP